MPNHPSTIERWKLDLIRWRAFRSGFRGPDLDDALQEVAIEVVAFTFQPERANGASLTTALVALIDKRLAMVRRTARRYQQRFEQTPLPQALKGDEPLESPCSNRIETRLDVRGVLARLPEEDRELCHALAEGESIDAIAARRSCSWHTVNRRIRRLREDFERAGIDGVV